MNVMAQAGGRPELRRQSRRARRLGSPFVADVLAAADRQLELAPETAALISGWKGDPSAAALGLRLNSALHALARRGKPEGLAALYRRIHDGFDIAVAEALETEDGFIAEWMRGPTQTNEVGRAAALGAALMVLREQTGLPAELLEVGSSCGLNLNLARYAYDLGGVKTGAPEFARPPVSALDRGLPPAQPIEIVGARGVDLNPLDPRDSGARERLLAYVWADKPQRAERLERALEIARTAIPDVERADARHWLAQRLAEPQRVGVARVVMHSMVLQYLDRDDRRAFVTMMARAGRAATPERPLARIGFEWNLRRTEVRLLLTTWPGGSTRLLAVCHPYGEWIDWRRLTDQARAVTISTRTGIRTMPSRT